jgi:outer membrane biosynthesis protein TonB
MTTVAIPIVGGSTDRATRQRLSLSMLASVLVHALAIAMLVGLLAPFPIALDRLGGTSPLKVALVDQKPILFSPPPETPPTLAEPSLAPRPIVPALPVAIEQAQPAMPADNHKQRAAPPLGVSVRSNAGAEVAPTDPPPPGDTAVGAIEDSARVGHAQELRLAQRFPRVAGNPARLHESLVVPYPPRAARAHMEARIAALVILDADGRVVETTLYPDEPYFGPTVLNVIKGAKFKPADVDGKPAPYWTILEFVFTLRPMASR